MLGSCTLCSIWTKLLADFTFSPFQSTYSSPLNVWSKLPFPAASQRGLQAPNGLNLSDKELSTLYVIHLHFQIKSLSAPLHFIVSKIGIRPMPLALSNTTWSSFIVMLVTIWTLAYAWAQSVSPCD